MHSESPSASQLTDSLPTRSHTSPLSQALTSERAERREEGKKMLLQRQEHRNPEGKEGPRSQQKEESKTKREMPQPPLASWPAEWHILVNGSF
eukprot:bmy_21998T0